MIKRRGGLEAKELAWLLFLFFLVQVANLFLFGDVRFSSGVPGGHAGEGRAIWSDHRVWDRRRSQGVRDC